MAGMVRHSALVAPSLRPRLLCPMELRPLGHFVAFKKEIATRRTSTAPACTERSTSPPSSPRRPGRLTAAVAEMPAASAALCERLRLLSSASTPTWSASSSSHRRHHRRHRHSRQAHRPHPLRLRLHSTSARLFRTHCHRLGHRLHRSHRPLQCHFRHSHLQRSRSHLRRTARCHHHLHIRPLPHHSSRHRLRGKPSSLSPLTPQSRALAKMSEPQSSRLSVHPSAVTCPAA